MYQVFFPLLTGWNTNYFQPTMSSKDHSACFFFFFFSIVPWVLVVSSYACDEQHSRPEANPFIDLIEFSMLLSPLWYSTLCFLATLACLNSELLSSQLLSFNMESSGLCLCSPLLCCNLEMLDKQKLGQLKDSLFSLWAKITILN